MFFKYTYAAGTTQANFLNDIKAVLTGATTDKATLSANCVQASTEIIATTPAGWEVWDNRPTTDYDVIRAPCADGSTYKYVQLQYAPGKIWLKGYESWNATTHVGTNLCTDSDHTTTGMTTVNLTSGGTIYFYASARALAAWHTDTKAAFIMEHTRDEPWDTVANGQPCWGHVSHLAFSSSNTSTMYKPRRLNGPGSDLTGANAKMRVLGPYGYDTTAAQVYENLYYTSPIGMVKDASWTSVIPLVPIQVTNGGTATQLATIGGRVYDFLLTSSNIGGMNDELTYGGQQYIIFANSAHVVIPKF